MFIRIHIIFLPTTHQHDLSCDVAWMSFFYKHNSNNMHVQDNDKVKTMMKIFIS